MCCVSVGLRLWSLTLSLAPDARPRPPGRGPPPRPRDTARRRVAFFHTILQSLGPRADSCVELLYTTLLAHSHTPPELPARHDASCGCGGPRRKARIQHRSTLCAPKRDLTTCVSAYICLRLRGRTRLACLCLLARDRVAQQEGGEGEGRGDAFTLLQHPRVPQEDDRPGGTCRPEVRVGTRVKGEGEGEG